MGKDYSPTGITYVWRLWRHCLCRHGWYPLFVAPFVTIACILDIYSSAGCDFMRLDVGFTPSNIAWNESSANLGLFYYESDVVEENQFLSLVHSGCRDYTPTFEDTFITGDRTWRVAQVMGLISGIAGMTATATVWLLTVTPLPASFFWPGVLLPSILVSFLTGGAKFMFFDTEICHGRLWSPDGVAVEYTPRRAKSCELGQSGKIAIAAASLFFLNILFVCLKAPLRRQLESSYGEYYEDIEGDTDGLRTDDMIDSSSADNGHGDIECQSVDPEIRRTICVANITHPAKDPTRGSKYYENESTMTMSSHSRRNEYDDGRDHQRKSSTASEQYRHLGDVVKPHRSSSRKDHHYDDEIGKPSQFKKHERRRSSRNVATYPGYAEPIKPETGDVEQYDLNEAVASASAVTPVKGIVDPSERSPSMKIEININGEKADLVRDGGITVITKGGDDQDEVVVSSKKLYDDKQDDSTISSSSKSGRGVSTSRTTQIVNSIPKQKGLTSSQKSQGSQDSCMTDDTEPPADPSDFIKPKPTLVKNLPSSSLNESSLPNERGSCESTKQKQKTVVIRSPSPPPSVLAATSSVSASNSRTPSGASNGELVKENELATSAAPSTSSNGEVPEEKEKDELSPEELIDKCVTELEKSFKGENNMTY